MSTAIPTRLKVGEDIRQAVKAQAEVGLPLDKSDPSRPIPYRWEGGPETDNAVTFRVQAEDQILFLKVIKPLESPAVRDAYRTLEKVRREYAAELGDHLCDAWLREKVLPVQEGNSAPVLADIVVMPWIDHPTLFEFVHDCCRFGDRQRVLREFAANFRRFVTILHRLGIVHGDYNSLNIHVTPDRQPFLVDFDSFSLHPNFRNAAQVIGMGAFQPPGKYDNLTAYQDFGERLDYYSEWIVYVSLVAYTILPGHPGPSELQSESLFLRLEDLKPPYTGPAFQSLLTSSNPIMAGLGRRIQAECCQGPDIANWVPLEYLQPQAEYERWESDRTPPSHPKPVFS